MKLFGEYVPVKYLMEQHPNLRLGSLNIFSNFIKWINIEDHCYHAVSLQLVM